MAAKDGLLQVCPDILCAQEIRDWDVFAELTSVLPKLKPLIVSRFRGSPRGSPLSLKQTAIASVYPVDSAWYEPFKPSVSTPPRGFSFAAIPIGKTMLLVYSVHLKSGIGGLTKTAPKREEAPIQLVAHVADMEALYGKRGPVAVVIAGDFNTDPTDPQFAGEDSVTWPAIAGFLAKHPPGIPPSRRRREKGRTLPHQRREEIPQKAGRAQKRYKAVSRTIDVACLVLVSVQERFLTTLRPAHKTLGNHWEFPGGKVESRERPEIALRRELREELHLEVNALQPLHPTTHAYDFAIVRLLPFISYCEDLPQIHLAEHAASRWVTMSEARELIWAPADLPNRAQLSRELGVSTWSLTRWKKLIGEGGAGVGSLGRSPKGAN